MAPKLKAELIKSMAFSFCFENIAKTINLEKTLRPSKDNLTHFLFKAFPMKTIFSKGFGKTFLSKYQLKHQGPYSQLFIFFAIYELA
jgi:hypothetical protein